MPAPTIHDVLLDHAYSLGAQMDPARPVKTIITGSGAEQRIGLWANSRRRWNVRVQGLTYDQRQALEVFYDARGGNLSGFRFKAPESYTTGVVKHSLVEITATTFQLVLTGTSGAQSVARNIYLPVTGTVAIFDGVTPVVSGFAVNLLTGVVTFDVDPSYAPSATFDYHIPVRFDSVPQFSQDYPLNFNVEFSLIELTQ